MAWNKVKEYVTLQNYICPCTRDCMGVMYYNVIKSITMYFDHCNNFQSSYSNESILGVYEIGMSYILGKVYVCLYMVI